MGWASGWSRGGRRERGMRERAREEGGEAARACRRRREAGHKTSPVLALSTNTDTHTSNASSTRYLSLFCSLAPFGKPPRARLLRKPEGDATRLLAPHSGTFRDARAASSLRLARRPIAQAWLNASSTPWTGRHGPSCTRCAFPRGTSGRGERSRHQQLLLAFSHASPATPPPSPIHTHAHSRALLSSVRTSLLPPSAASATTPLGASPARVCGRPARRRRIVLVGTINPATTAPEPARQGRPHDAAARSAASRSTSQS
jgi:hypothetical protein